MHFICRLVTVLKEHHAELGDDTVEFPIFEWQFLSATRNPLDFRLDFIGRRDHAWCRIKSNHPAGLARFCKRMTRKHSRPASDVQHVTTFLDGCPIDEMSCPGFEQGRHKKRFIPPIASGQVLGAFALTEAGAGSDPAAMETTAARKDNGYVLNGSKIFITNGAEASIIVVFAATDKALRHKGITALIVEKDTPGFSVGKHERKMGIRGSSTVELVFEDCFVPEENRLGNEGDGFRIAINTIDASRVVVAAQALGIAQGAFDRALAYAKERQQFGQPIINFQAVQWMLADMATQIDAARLLIYRAAYLQDQGQPFIKEASMAKVYAAETSSFVASKAVQIFGGYGYVKEYPVERYLRDAKITEIYEGTSEMQRMTIARQLMKEG